MSSRRLSIEPGWRFTPEKDVSPAKDVCDMSGDHDFLAALTARIVSLKLPLMSGGSVPRYV